MTTSPAKQKGQGLAFTERVEKLVAPSVLLAVAMIVFQAGVYVGRGPYAVLEERLLRHENGVHRDSMPRSEISLALKQLRVEMRADREVLEQQLVEVNRKLDRVMP